MPDFYAEPFLHLAGLTHESALIAWGAFYFKVKDSGQTFKLVDDEDLDHINPPRHQSIGARSEPYGPAHVEVFDKDQRLVASAFTADKNHCWVVGLKPDKEYTYRVIVKDDVWARHERRDWVADDDFKGLKQMGNRYTNRFRTYPDPSHPAPGPLTFAVIGDFGTGIRKKDRPQRKVADALKKAVDRHDVRLVLTTGDNIYASKKFLGLLPIGGTGDEDDDWYFTFYQPYRYIINRVPVYPSMGNHDSDETEAGDDRGQAIDNFYVDERIARGEAVGRVSNDLGVFYKFRYGSEIEFICIDTSKDTDGFNDRLYKHPSHAEFLNQALPPRSIGAGSSPAWRIPFSHHPPFSGGPQHHNTRGMDELVDQFERAGVRVVFSGHEHNFQHCRFNDINYFVTGAAGKIREGRPNRFEKAQWLSWCAAYHFLIVTIDGQQMTVRAFGAEGGDELTEIARADRNNNPVTDPMVITLS